MEFNIPDRPETFKIQIAIPMGVSSSWLIIFSHGFKCHLEGNDELIRNWASHGYSIIQPLHLDGEPNSKVDKYSEEIVWQERRRDMERSVDILSKIPEFKDQILIDKNNVIAAGHSYGGITAQSAGGAKTYSRGDLNKNIYEPDPRFKGILAISPPGFIDGFIDKNTTSEIKIPMLITTGTKDAIPPMMPNWQSHTDTYKHAMLGNKYLAVIENADHRFGGLICGETNTSKQYKELKALQAVTLAFLDLVTQNNEKAKNYINKLTTGYESNIFFEFKSK